MNFLELNEHLVEHLISVKALKTTRIIEAFRKTPRHLFVSKEYLSHAYDDIPLPTYNSQTISQPYTVAIMTEALGPRLDNKILEIGSGSGYQAALLSRCVGPKGKIITVELEKKLVEFAKKNLEGAKIKNVKVIEWDGKKGYEKEAPYDRCIITAGCDEVPKPILNQTKVGGKIVAPVNDFWGQKMLLVEKLSDKKFKTKDLGSFVFVPLR
jgi:protein-L-isoaspartate(D-aspartate) O-methyltransferase